MSFRHICRNPVKSRKTKSSTTFTGRRGFLNSVNDSAVFVYSYLKAIATIAEDRSAGIDFLNLETFA